MHKIHSDMKNSPSRSSCKPLQYLWAGKNIWLLWLFIIFFFCGKEEVRTSKIARYFIPRSPRFNLPFFQRFGSSSIPWKKIDSFPFDCFFIDFLGNGCVKRRASRKMKLEKLFCKNRNGNNQSEYWFSLALSRFNIVCTQEALNNEISIKRQLLSKGHSM